MESHEHCLRMVQELEEEKESLLTHMERLEGEKSGLLCEQQRLRQQVSDAQNSQVPTQTQGLQVLMQEMLGSLTNWQQQVSGFTAWENAGMFSMNPGETFWTGHHGELGSPGNIGLDPANCWPWGSSDPGPDIVGLLIHNFGPKITCANLS